MIRKFNPKEEEIMNILWKKKKAYVKEIIKEMDDPKPHYNTVSSTVRKLEKEGYIGHVTKDRAHRYYAITKRKEYRSLIFDHLFHTYFKGSKQKYLKYSLGKLRLKKSELRSIIKTYKYSQF